MRVHIAAGGSLYDRDHTWRDEVSGRVLSILDLGAVDILFDSADEARKVGERCLKIADAIASFPGEGPAR